MENKTRCFLAIEFSETVTSGIVKITQTLRGSRIPGIKWVSPENLHLTIKFFGDLFDPQIQKIVGTASEICANVNPFEIQFKGFGAFPSWSRPRVIWEGLEMPGELTALYNTLENRFLCIGLSKEPRGFSPHLTLARVRPEFDPSKNQQLISSFQSLPDPDLGLVHIDHLTLFKSVLQPVGSVYTPIYDFHFRPVSKV
jgi:RNA 2',3'-cyclic 3'-phosphodiesterase